MKQQQIDDFAVMMKIGALETENFKLRQQLEEANGKVAELERDKCMLIDSNDQVSIELANAHEKIADLTARLEAQEASEPVAWAIIDKWGQVDGGLVDGKHPPYPPNEITGVQNWSPLFLRPPTEKAEIERLKADMDETLSKLKLSDETGDRWRKRFYEASDEIADLTVRLEASEELNKKLQSLVDANQKLMDVQDRRENRQARLEAQEASEPVATICMPDPDDERDGVRFNLKDWEKLNAFPAGTKLYTTPQPTPNVKAAVAAALRKAAEVCDNEADQWNKVKVTMDDMPHPSEVAGMCEKRILAIPRDDSALREICLKVLRTKRELENYHEDAVIVDRALRTKT